jgi:hypothetical protein
LQISNSTGQRYHQPQQYEPLLCQEPLLFNV